MTLFLVRFLEGGETLVSEEFCDFLGSDSSLVREISYIASDFRCSSLKVDQN